jgi:hypothetical protein
VLILDKILSEPVWYALISLCPLTPAHVRVYGPQKHTLSAVIARLKCHFFPLKCNILYHSSFWCLAQPYWSRHNIIITDNTVITRKEEVRKQEWGHAAVTLEISVSWDVTPRSLIYIYWHFRASSSFWTRTQRSSETLENIYQATGCYIPKGNKKLGFFEFTERARCGKVGWGTMLQAGRSWARDPVRWKKFFSIYLTLRTSAGSWIDPLSSWCEADE